MSNVSDQIHRYRAIKAQESPARPADDTLVLERQHPTKKDYFQNLMQRWHEDYLKKILPLEAAAQHADRTKGDNF